MFQDNFDIICEVCSIVFVVVCAKFFGLPVLNPFRYLRVKDGFFLQLFNISKWCSCNVYSLAFCYSSLYSSRIMH